MKKITLAGINLLLSALLLAQPPQHEGPPKPPPVAERWMHDSTRLQLYVVLLPAQIVGIKAAYTSFYTAMDSFMEKHTAAPPTKEQHDLPMKRRDEALAQIFTPEQTIRFHTFHKELSPPHPEGPPRRESNTPPDNF